MSQVLASINHNLQEEYTATKLPNQEAKDRLLADAQFLHEKLSTLKNIAGASTAMLLTVVSEKVPANAPKRVPANQRIKGMLSGSSNSPREDTTPANQLPLRSVSPSPAPTSRPNSPVPPNLTPTSPQPMLSPPPVSSPANGIKPNSRPTTPVPSPPLPPLPLSPQSASTTQPNGVNGH